MIIPDASFKLAENDHLTIFGPPDVLFDMREKFDPKQKIDVARVVIYGGGEAAICLIRMLSNPRFKIRVIEKDPEKCEVLAEKFPNVATIHGDATSRRLLEEEQIGSVDYFVACTSDDEDNILTCLQASKLGAKHVQLVVNKGDYDKLSNTLKDDLNIEVVVSPRIAMTDYMQKYLRNTPITELSKLPKNSGFIFEIKIMHNSPCINKKIKDISLPKGTLIAALLHKFKAKVPSGEDIVLAGDRLIVITSPEKEKFVLNTLIG